MQLSIRHTTQYRFGTPASHGLQRLRLRPKSTHGQSVIEWHMELEGARLEAEYDDQHCNQTALVSVDPGVEAVKITCTGRVMTSNKSGVIGHHSGFMPLWCFRRQTPLTAPGPKMRALAARLGGSGGGSDRLALLHNLSQQIHDSVAYEIGFTDAETTAESAMAAGRGVCQDHAHIFIGLARTFGIPARYVSGYLMMDDRIDQEAGHAWAEAFVDGLGWVAFDVSNGISADARYVRIASGCDYREAAPVTGITYGTGDSALTVSLAVEQQIAEQ